MHEYQDKVKKLRVKRVITVIIFVIIVPAVYTAYTFVQENNFSQQADTFVAQVFEDRGYVVIYRNIDYSQSNKRIELAFLAEKFSPDQISEFRDRLDDFGLTGTELDIRQDGFSLTEEEWQSALSDARGDNEKVQALEARLESERLSFESPAQLLKEAQSINQKINNLAIGSIAYGSDTADNADGHSVALVYTSASNTPLTMEEADSIKRWLGARVGESGVDVYFKPNPVVVVATSTIEMVIQ